MLKGVFTIIKEINDKFEILGELESMLHNQIYLLDLRNT